MLEVSDLLFPAFRKSELEKLSDRYGIEIFTEFGNEAYWNTVLIRQGLGKRRFSVHGPCVTVNLANRDDSGYKERYERTFTYAKKIGASYVVVHTNESWEGDRAECQNLVRHRLCRLEGMSRQHEVPMLIENVGLMENNLFDEDEFISLFSTYAQAAALIDTGHAHVNSWDMRHVIRTLGSRIHAFHIHDNCGLADEHLPVLSGTIDWKDLFDDIHAYVPEAIFVAEYSCGFSSVPELEKHLHELECKFGL